MTIVFLVLNLLIGIAIPVGLCIFWRVRRKCSLAAFFTGCGVMLLFALGLEQIVHRVVLGSAAGAVIQGNLWLYALYGGLMAGLFEETGRLLGMKLLLKKKQDNDYNALMYGAGHGGFEAFVILFFGMLNNLIYALMINSGQSGLLLQSLDEATGATMQAVFQTLSQSSPFLFLAAPVERIAAVAGQIALSVLVWIAATRKNRTGLYFLAILLHFLLDAVAVVCSGLGVPTALVELAVILIAAAYLWLAAAMWRKNGLGGRTQVCGE
ncbi:MAG: YhfC family intramembrane metalloprotease [Roseburia sp.]|nr:YhfC family intramembrane metalloprotease [Roseburia sp.]MCM1099434.1 YhfC family intramembrane metalloprotease [Ruminococcus flavefaciens]